MQVHGSASEGFGGREKQYLPLPPYFHGYEVSLKYSVVENETSLNLKLF